MAVGLCAAWPFRKTLLDDEDFPAATPPPMATSLPPPLAAPKLSVQRTDESSPSSPALEPEIGAGPLTTVLDRGGPRRKLLKLDQTAPLPRLPVSFASQSRDEAVPRDPAAAEPADDSVSHAPAPPRDRRYYRIGKYDTLEAIAERFLGSREHAEKLLAANAQTIRVREILPVGATIVIPELHESSETIVRLPASGDE